ncbi:hypothetical protein MBLNU459_g5220t1 [Dothideomycetes sp. NU459]
MIEERADERAVERAERIHGIVQELEPEMEALEQRLDATIREWRERDPEAVEKYDRHCAWADETTESMVRRYDIRRWIDMPVTMRHILRDVSNIWHQYTGCNQLIRNAEAGSDDVENDPPNDPYDDDQWIYAFPGGLVHYGFETMPHVNGFADFRIPRSNDERAIQGVLGEFDARGSRYLDALSRLELEIGDVYDFHLPNQWDIWLHSALRWIAENYTPPWEDALRRLDETHRQITTELADYDDQDDRTLWIRTHRVTLRNSGRVTYQRVDTSRLGEPDLHRVRAIRFDMPPA